MGKTHTYPQRDRIGFDDVQLDDEGRTLHGVTDDYEIFLGDQGHVGQQFGHGISNNAYQATAWHLPERLHATNWATDTMARYVRRRDPSRPSFWYLGYRHPHPPLVPPQRFLDHYDDIEIDMPFAGDWSTADLPYNLQGVQARNVYSEREIRWARRAFYALCTQIDQQIGALIGTIREEGILDETIIMFTSDHGDMLGNHGMWAKQTFFEGSSNVPMILMGKNGDDRLPFGSVDDRVTGLQDIMPTLLGLAGIEPPSHVDGRSMVSDAPRDYIYGEFGEDSHSSRMVRDQRHKLIWYPVRQPRPVVRPGERPAGDDRSRGGPGPCRNGSAPDRAPAVRDLRLGRRVVGWRHAQGRTRPHVSLRPPIAASISSAAINGLSRRSTRRATWSSSRKRRQGTRHEGSDHRRVAFGMHGRHTAWACGA